MPRTFALTAHYAADIADVYAAFGDEEYWRARLRDSGADVATLDSIRLDADGMAITTTQAISRNQLPGLAAQLLPGDLTVVRTESWGPLRHSGAAGTGEGADAVITGEIVGAPATLTGTAALRRDESGCAIDFSATVRVDVPLVGGKIEDLIGAQLHELIAAEQQFTSEWIGGSDPGMST